MISTEALGSPEDSGNDALARALTHPILISLVAALSLAQGVGGLYRLADYREDHAAAISGQAWAITFGPPTWVVLLLIALLASLALMLAWRLATDVNARWLALFSALLASGYGVMVTAVSSPLFDGYIRAIPVLQDLGVDLQLLRAGGHAVAGLERLLWIAGWAFAGTVSIHFVRRVLGRIASPGVDRAAEAALVQWSFACVSMALPHSVAMPAVAVVLAVLGLAAWYGVRRTGSTGSSWVLAAATAFSLFESLRPMDRPEALIAELVIAAVLMPAAAWRTSLGRPYQLFLFPALLSLAAAHSSDAVPMALALMFLWIAVCICVVVATVLYCLRTRVLDGRRQAMWFLSGCMVAATAALAWPLLVWGGRSAGCALDSESAVCTLYRYQDWFLLAPLPILLASFVMGLLYRGPIDAARLFRRTAVYGSMLLLSLFVLGAAEALLGDFVRKGLPWETPPLVAAGVMAVVFYPAKRTCDRGVERLLARLLVWSDKSE
ncbi:MAG: hypothetical protein WBO04_07555 [Steroidobacteraceae bacterium]